MQGIQPNFQYEWVKTGDGSPSLRLWKEGQAPECMHHSAGALTESLYIYGEALQKTHVMLGPMDKVRVLSLGLGLGYNEMIAVALAIKLNFLHRLQMDSFESEEFLNQNFIGWLESPSENSEWLTTYTQILQQLAKKLELAPEEIFRSLLKLRQSDQWRMNQAFSTEFKFDSPYNCLFFDAFSAGATPKLWDQDFLVSFLNKFSQRPCVLSTYAATGNLKRALKATGFKLEPKPGFAGKRQSTLAFRQ